MRRTLNAPIKYAALFYRGIAPGERYCRGAAMLTLRLYFRRHFKAATSVPPLDHVRVAPAGECALRADFFYFIIFFIRGSAAGGDPFQETVPADGSNFQHGSSAQAAENH